jgi:hypothetical protein
MLRRAESIGWIRMQHHPCGNVTVDVAGTPQPREDPMNTLLWLAGGVFALFAALDLWIAPAEKKRLWEFLKSKPTALDELPRAAQSVFTRVFGETHFSLRCIVASVIASVLFLLFLYAFRMHLVIAAYPTANASEIYRYIVDEISYPFSSMARASFAISLAINLVLDYFGLLKTRWIIAFLARRRSILSLISIAIVIDLAVSFLVFQTLYLVLYFVSLSMIFGQQMILIPGGDPRSFLPVFSELMILLQYATSPDYPAGATMEFLRHSHIIQIFLAFTFFPVFLTSVFFYASIAPSIWLWLFLFAGMVSRLLASTWPSALEFFNFEQNPLRMLGGLAAVLVLLFGTCILAVYHFWLVVLSLLLQL